MPGVLLVVEDDRPTHTLLVTIGQRCGLEVVSAFDGEAAIQILQLQQFDAVILDLLLPRKDGFEVLRHMTQSSSHHLDRTIVITAASLAKTVDYPELKLVRKFLRKPLDVTDLIDELNHCARGRASSAEV